jgi:hypothetical protein
MLGIWRRVLQGVDDVNGDEETPLPTRRQLGSGVPVGLGAGFTLGPHRGGRAVVAERVRA